ncbi:fimbrial protein [Pantoea dispersa]|uniref:fimbrial protein n=1 Tax=Pantoea dispersa TaxID=59814 RepID=UPI002DBB4E49|nr:fimbrial protein [Pantoea dispersa]MEB5974303.1 hypothetical protein [Pantoea dispersa]
MKSKKSVLFAMMGIFAAASVQAQTGTVSISGSVVGATCTINGMNQTANFGNIDQAELQALSNGNVHKQETMTIEVTACPSSISKVTITPTFTAELGNGPRIAYTGPMKGAGLWLVNGDDDKQMYSATGYSKDLVANATTFTLKPSLVRFTGGGQSGSANVVAGDFAATVNLAMTYE